MYTKKMQPASLGEPETELTRMPPDSKENIVSLNWNLHCQSI